MSTRTKKCIGCGEVKEMTDFWVDSRLSTGRTGRCADCMSRSRRGRKQYPERKREWTKRNAARVVAQKREWAERNPEKARAQQQVRNAVRDGRLHKATKCSECGEGAPLHGHHTDYARPLDVIWLCPSCHKDLHAAMDLRNSTGRRGS